MTALPQWLQQSLRCPVTGERLSPETRGGAEVLVARPAGGEPLVYEVEGGVPVLLPRT